MPCDYLLDHKTGRVRIVMLADIEFDEPAVGTAWHPTIELATTHYFGKIQACRKLAVRIPVPGRPTKECPFQHILKRDLPGASSSGFDGTPGV
jgi:hypothetical protein